MNCFAMAAALSDTPTPAANITMMPDLQVSVKVEQTLYEENVEELGSDNAGNGDCDDGRWNYNNKLMESDSNHQLKSEYMHKNPSVIGGKMENLQENIQIKNEPAIDIVDCQGKLNDIEDFQKTIQIQSEPPTDINDSSGNDIGGTAESGISKEMGLKTHLPKIQLKPTTKLMPTPKAANPKRRYECPIWSCTKSYGKSSHLRSHLTWHTGMKPFVCNSPGCGKGFTRSDELNRHIRTHTGEKPFECPKCGKKFSRSDHLTKHVATHTRAVKSGDGTDGPSTVSTTPKRPKMSKTTPNFSSMKTSPGIKGRSLNDLSENYSNNIELNTINDFAKHTSTKVAIEHANHAFMISNLSQEPATNFAQTPATNLKQDSTTISPAQRKRMIAAAVAHGGNASPINLTQNRQNQPAMVTLPFSSSEMMQSPRLPDLTPKPTHIFSTQSSNTFSDEMHFMAGLITNITKPEAPPKSDQKNFHFQNSPSGIAKIKCEQPDDFQDFQPENLTFESENALNAEVKYEAPEENEYTYPGQILSDIEAKMYIKTETQQKYEDEAEIENGEKTIVPDRHSIEDDDPDDDAIMPEANLPPLPLAIISASSICGTPKAPPTSGSIVTVTPRKKNKVEKSPEDGLRPFPCTQCPKSFKRQDDLNRHMRTHTGEKPFQCNECDKRFMRSDHLKKHLNVHVRIR